jgi:hypothetical protein
MELRSPIMTTQQVSNVPTHPQIAGRRIEANAAFPWARPERGLDVGFDDMNIPGWSDFVEARIAALRRICCSTETPTGP